MKNTSLCYIEKDGKYLMLHRIRKQNDVNFDKWIGIGGKFEEDESPYDCARREIFEETSLEVKKLCYRGIVTFICQPYESEQMHLFTATEFSGSISKCDEGVLEWVDKSRLKDLKLWEGDYIFLDLLDKNTPFFALKLCYNGDKLEAAYLGEEKIV